MVSASLRILFHNWKIECFCSLFKLFERSNATMRVRRSITYSRTLLSSALACEFRCSGTYRCYKICLQIARITSFSIMKSSCSTWWSCCVPSRLLDKQVKIQVGRAVRGEGLTDPELDEQQVVLCPKFRYMVISINIHRRVCLCYKWISNGLRNIFDIFHTMVEGYYTNMRRFSSKFACLHLKF